jgi:hypothetical protein
MVFRQWEGDRTEMFLKHFTVEGMVSVKISMGENINSHLQSLINCTQKRRISKNVQKSKNL